MAKKKTETIAASDGELQSIPNNNYALPEAVAEKFEVVGTQVHGYFPGFGEVDMRKLTVAAANSLIENGFPYLKAK
jgi:hypothetical protein